MMIGYARVSTDEQKLDLQIQALQQAGCERIFTDHGQSGADFGRDGLEETMRNLKPCDVLVVWRLDRLGRSLTGLVGLMDEIGKRGIHFRSLMENIDTASSGGRLMFHLMAALAEFERSIISERTKAGLAVAKREGRQLGRPKILTSEQIAAANDMIARGASTVDDIAAGLRVSTRTLRRHIDCTKLSTGPKSRLGLKNGP